MEACNDRDLCTHASISLSAVFSSLGCELSWKKYLVVVFGTYGIAYKLPGTVFRGAIVNRTKCV